MFRLVALVGTARVLYDFEESWNMRTLWIVHTEIRAHCGIHTETGDAWDRHTEN